jgi:Cu(I)/Ag(I) efflux system membrane protein CusA/SilA
MLAKIIDWSIRNKFLVILATVFIIGAGVYALATTPVDAIPDLSDVQVIVYTEYPGQSPRTVEDQVTYPLTTSLVSVPGSKVVRGYSFFGYSLVYVIFEDGTDIYWARSRVLEYLNYGQKRLPAGVTPVLGPDATGLGWVYEYTLTSHTKSLAELRSIQDWFLKYQLSSVPGVAEVASIGGFVKEYQITVDPARLQAYNLPLDMVETAIKRANNDVGGEVMEMGEMEFMVRGLGYIKSIDDLKNIPVMASPASGAPVYLRDIADISEGPLMRRGVADLNGEGEVAGGIIVMRYGANALKVIDGVKQKLAELKSQLPEDVKITIAYDRSGLILRAIDTLRQKLIEEILIVALVCILFLLHFRSSMVAVFTLPTAILMAFIVMRLIHVNANIMSLGGIAIAIGAMVDAAIIMIENAHKHLEAEKLKAAGEQREHWRVVSEASRQVGPALFYSLLVITVSFIPVFALTGQAGRMFKPLAYTKTFSMAAAAILSITIIPILMGYFVRGKMLSEQANPLNRLMTRMYHPAVKYVLKFNWLVILAAVVVVGLTVIPFSKLGSEFMPPLWEGDLLYMPTTLPGISITKARELLQQTDKIIKSFPEVQNVFGKAGRAESATDPAGLDMMETTILLKPQNEWSRGETPRELIDKLDAAAKIPGLTNVWTMPIKARVDMLSTGIKTPVGIKVSGPDLNVLDKIGAELEPVIRGVPGTASVYAERQLAGNYLDIRVDRQQAGRYGLNVQDIEDVIAMAMGGMPITTTVEGLERYPVNLRYSRELRDNIDAIKRVLVPAPGGAQIPLEQVAQISIQKGPMVIRSEATRPTLWVYIDIQGTDIGGYVAAAKKAVAQNIQMPAGYTLHWSGEFEYMEEAYKRLEIIIPVTIFIIFIIIYLNTRSITKTAIVFLAIPFSIVGAVWILFLLHYNMSIAVWVGIIALAGLDAETGVVMLLYLDHAFDDFQSKGMMQNLEDLKKAIDQGAVKRVRPKIMTASVIIAGLLPIMWSSGAGADVMKRIAAPMVGGITTSVIMELLVYPAIYYLWKSRELGKVRLPATKAETP